MQVKGTNLSPRSVMAAVSGNILEWYDFTVYGFLAPILGRIFFPSDDHIASLLASFAVLAVGYAARPVGSVIFGHIGDRFGRKPAMIWSVLIMGAGSVAVGLLPTHAQIGFAAALLLTAVRIIQGIAVAGEYTASGVLVIEEASPSSRFFVGSWIPFAMMWGCVLGSGVPAVVSSTVSTEAMSAWGWRLPFFAGGLLALVSLVLRLYMNESSAMAKVARTRISPVFAALTRHWREILQMIGLLIPTAIIYFIIFVYAASYLTDQMHFSTSEALDISTLNLVIIAFVVLAAGYAADRLGYRAVFLIGVAGTFLFAWPLWYLMHGTTLGFVFAGQLGFSILNAIGWALSLTVLSGLVPADVRCSAVAIGYNCCMAAFGGTTPFIATYLVARTGDDFAPVYYVLAATAVSLAVVLKLPKTLEF
ncbi:MFS transporter [Stappia sp. GBMRC 2046]|uniref:MFS transporter n=1 Tax=Stappia sediminis TaxID=2692190 RepID=A0A7X3LRJ9_9HYPH|nr:MFS transporter [Stappia sediminis]MXN63771.1 MFS transporter [Stappia sediminis]